jgi:hypothetical protein
VSGGHLELLAAHLAGGARLERTAGVGQSVGVGGQIGNEGAGEGFKSLKGCHHVGHTHTVCTADHRKWLVINVSKLASKRGQH